MSPSRAAAAVLALAFTAGMLTPPAAAAEPRERVVLRAVVAGDFIDTDSRHDRLWQVWPRRPVTIALGDLVHKNAPRELWEREWMPRWGSLPPCRVWSVPGNHEYGWARPGTRWAQPARGATYRHYRGWFHRKCPSVASDGTQWAKRRPGWLLVGVNTERCTAAAVFLRTVTDRMPRRHVAVFMHRPPILPPGSAAPPLRCASLARLVDERATVVLAGHSHRFYRAGRVHIAGTVVTGTGWAVLTLYRGGEYRVRFVRPPR